MPKKAKFTFRKMLNECGYSGEVADELWKWYDFYEKKGIANF